MHELHITQELLDQAIYQGKNAQASQIGQVHLTIGELSGYTEDAVRFYWEQISLGTIAEAAELRIRHEEGKYLCFDCAETHYSSDVLAVCPHCGNHSLQVIAGKDVYLEALDIVPETVPSANP